MADRSLRLEDGVSIQLVSLASRETEAFADEDAHYDGFHSIGFPSE